MIVTGRAYWAPKAGNQPEEYEDAFWPAGPLRPPARRRAKRTGKQDPAGRDPAKGAGKDARASMRFAVADGATETSFAGLWARRLVRAYSQGCFEGDDWIDRLRREQAAWYDEVLQKPLPWYAEDKVRDGAYAALLGLELAATGEWRSLAIGDCCLIQWRGEELVGTFPAQDAAFFTSRPYLLSSNASRNAGLPDQVQRTAGQWLPRDRFALVSDALGQWVLRRLEAGEPPWQLFAEIQEGSPRRFEHWIGELRAASELRNDDVTALLLEVA